MRLLRLSLLSAILGLTVAGTATDASAKTSRKVSHSYEKVWPTAVRFLRIDEGFVLIEKDMENGYLLFELKDEGKLFTGSVEVIRRKDHADRDSVELVLHIKDRPSYMEGGILDRLLLKIRKELGYPKPPESKAPAPVDDETEEPPKDSDTKATAPTSHSIE